MIQAIDTSVVDTAVAEAREKVDLEETTHLTEQKIEQGKEPIDSDTFEPTGKKLGNGCWGNVDLYKDSSGQEWAIKYFASSPNFE
jgi:hypothetical protein